MVWCPECGEPGVAWPDSGCALQATAREAPQLYTIPIFRDNIFRHF